MATLFYNRYKLITQIGEGSYGSVYEAIDQLFNKEVVLKVGRHSLYNEAAAYSLLHKNWSPIGIPKVYSYEEANEYIIMQKLGKSLRHYWHLCRKRFSVKTVSMLGMQMISRLESVHNRGLVHGDIKDDNFVMAAENKGTVYIIDFGLSTTYIDINTGDHIPEDFNPGVLGTIHFASVNTHNKIRSTRRDDIEALVYVLIRFLKGRLPWEDHAAEFRVNFRAEFDKAGRKKTLISADTLCSGLPKEIKEFYKYARKLGFAERPNYGYLQQLLRSALMKENLNNDSVFDWMGQSSCSCD